MRKFIFRLKVRGCERVFSEELGPGVLATQEVSFDGKKPYRGATALALLREEDLFIQSVIVVQIEEVQE